MAQKVTVPYCLEAKQQGIKLTMLTAYDYFSAQLVDLAGIDIILVGDSLGMVIQGHSNTLSVTLEEMIYHTKLVTRAASRALVVADMPFMSFQVSPEQAVRNAGRLIKEGGAHAVKLEGGERVLPQIKKILQAGIPVMGHLGLVPQSVHQFGGFKVQAKQKDEIARLRREAKLLEEVGVFSLVLEAIPSEVARQVTEDLHIPTIGIGAGPYCDGQVLVFHDVLGLSEFTGKFVKKYASLRETILSALQAYKSDVQSGVFPDESHAYHLS